MSNDSQSAIPPYLEFTIPPVQGDVRAAYAHNDRVEEQRRTQSVPYAVALGCSLVSLKDGRKLVAGDEVKLEDVAGSERVLVELSRQGVILTISQETLRARQPLEGATHRCRVATISRIRGVLDAGALCSAKDFCEPGRPAYARPATGELMPAVPASDGTAAIADLVARGIIEPLETAKPTTKGKSAA